MIQQDKLDRLGTHRVLDPKGVLPQVAWKLDNDCSKVHDNELLIDVTTLNIDSASFREISERAQGKAETIKSIIMKIVQDRGKMHNPVTGSGGVLAGRVEKIGTKAMKRIAVGDRIITLVSLSLTPLYLKDIFEIRPNAQIEVKGKAILFESELCVKLPTDMSERLAVSVLDVAGASPQVARLVRRGQTVIVLGGGKSGILSLYAARKTLGKSGTLIALGRSNESVRRLKDTGWADIVIQGDATLPVEVFRSVSEVTNNQMADVVVNCLNEPGTEMASILSCKEGGVVYFFNMATSFTAATLGAEGIGKDITMVMGNGYCHDHANFTLNLIRESQPLRTIFEESFV